MKGHVGIGSILLLIIPILVIFAIFIKFFSTPYTYSRYEEVANSDGSSLQIANYVLKTGYSTNTLSLGKIEPRSTPYTYNFTISNNDYIKRTDVNLTYDMDIVTTTNLPLEFKLYLNNDFTEDIITDRIIDTDVHDTFFQTLKTPAMSFGYLSDQINTYTLEVTYPAIYNDNIYQDVEEFVIINIDSRQKLSSDSSE